MINTKIQPVVTERVMTKKHLALAISIVADAFVDDVDKGGHPYFLHCYRVWFGVKDEDLETQIAAMLHDLVEDKPEIWTFDRLYEVGFSLGVISILKLLTHNKKLESYEDYIERISTDPRATKVKISDLKDNSDLFRLKEVTKKNLNKLSLYFKSYHYLSKL